MLRENRIGSERVRLGLTQKELARLLLVSAKAVSQWETGRSACPAKRLIQLAEIFQCSTDYLLGLTPERIRLLPQNENS